MSNSRKRLNSKLGKCSLYYCSVHKWILEAYSIEILGNYSVTCRDSIWSHLPWKTGQNLLFITRYNCQAGCAAEVGDFVEIPIVRRKCTFAWFVLSRDLGSSFLMWHFHFHFIFILEYPDFIITMYSGKIHRHEHTPQTQSARLYSVVKQYINLYIKKGDIVFQQ